MIGIDMKKKQPQESAEVHSSPFREDEWPEEIDGIRLIARPDIVAGPEDWPPVWFAFAQHRWYSMVLVPAHAGVSVLAVSRALANAGRAYDEPSLGLIEAERVAPARVQGIVNDLRSRGTLEQRTIVAVASPLEDNSAVPIIRGCDVAVLVVPLGETSLEDARRTMAVVGRGSFLGAITVSAH
ncbi:MAG: hypothetical protein IT355_10135 [Gemmatimonadaceae bacterium]|nr:hypothetical protein [Gemmatimonadaceae bacterium]